MHVGKEAGVEYIVWGKHLGSRLASAHSPRGASDLDVSRSLLAALNRFGSLRNVDPSLPSITNYLPNSFNMSGAVKLLVRHQFFRSARITARKEPYRCFSSSVQNAQQQNTPPPPGQGTPKTTHFGFETIAEALKEQKGSL